MNKIIILLLISFASFAQTEKGMFTAGNRVFSISSRVNGLYRYFELSPSVGKMVRNNLEYGVTLYVGNEKVKNGGDSYSRFVFQNYFTKYFGSNKLQPYLSFGIGPMLDTKSDISLGISASAGVQYFVAKNVSLSLYGAVSDLSIGGAYSNIGSSFNFYILPKSKKIKTIDL